MKLPEGHETLFPNFTGLSSPVPACEDPFAALDSLMSVVESLCPAWPQRPVETSRWIFKI